MEKSIETIWKDGFLENDALVAPKINNLYKQKSKQLSAKIKRTYKIDHLSTIPLALLFAIGFSYFGYIALGIYGMFLIFALFLFNGKKLRELESISIEDNSYEYLISFRKGIKTLIGFYSKWIPIVMPIVMIIAYWLYFESQPKFQLFIQAKSILYIAIFILVLALFLSITVYLIVKLSYKLLYGGKVKKLDEIIADMEELRA